MNSTQILCFLKAARSNNFTVSAAELFISQPAFSHNIVALEKEWGMDLFTRNNKHKNTHLTPAGAVMFDGMRKIQDQYENLLQNAHSIYEGKSGTLSIGLRANDRIDERTLRILDCFQKKFPDVELYLRRGNHSELIQWLYENTLDVAFTLKVDVEDKKWLALETLYVLESVLILKSDHPLARKENLSLADFKDETFVNLSEKESCAINMLLTIECENAGFIPKVVYAPDVSAQILYVESGRGVAIGSINNTAIFSEHITMIRLQDLKPMEIVTAWNRDNYNPCISMFYSAYEPIT